MTTLGKKCYVGLIVVCLVVFGALVAFAAYTENPYTTARTAGTRYNQGEYVTVQESELVHPTHADGFVNKGDQVSFGNNGVGVSMDSAAAATDYIAIETTAVYALSVTPAAAMTIGDRVYVDAITALLSDSNVDIPFGYTLHDITLTGSAGVYAIRVECD